jgi:hypothetical protein
MPAQPNRSLGLGLEVLQALCTAEGPAGSRELSRRLGWEHTRVNRLLGTLADLGLAERNPDRRYRPGPAVHVLAAASLGSSRLLAAALPEIRALHDAGWTVALGVRWRDQVCYLYHGGPGRPLEDNLAGHRLYPAAHSSIGHILDPGRTGRTARRAGWVRVVPPTGGPGSLAVPIGEPPVAGLAILATDDLSIPAVTVRLRAAAAAIASRLIGRQARRLTSPSAAPRPSAGACR